ncbi:CxxH/CxxC protein (TIGR04129 family) [Paenibacillus baekrokdamisoli]|nr:CxxH/CxxC protein (TIGR04129 family) [Paenibacillus baekrokdamisoli]
MTVGGIGQMYCVCKEHVELAIDKFVDDYEDAPDIVSLITTKFTDWEAPATCDMCSNIAEYLVV